MCGVANAAPYDGEAHDTAERDSKQSMELLHWASVEHPSKTGFHLVWVRHLKITLELLEFERQPRLLCDGFTPLTGPFAFIFHQALSAPRAPELTTQCAFGSHDPDEPLRIVGLKSGADRPIHSREHHPE